jgi:hypothetical protein
MDCRHRSARDCASSGRGKKMPASRPRRVIRIGSRDRPRPGSVPSHRRHGVRRPPRPASCTGPTSPTDRRRCRRRSDAATTASISRVPMAAGAR